MDSDKTTDVRAVFNKRMVFDGTIIASVGSRVVDFEMAVRQYLDNKNKVRFARSDKKGDEPVKSNYRVRDPSVWHIPEVVTGSETQTTETQTTETKSSEVNKPVKTSKRG